MAQLCQHQDELRGLNTEVLLISFGEARRARVWLEETWAPFQLLLDTERAVYRAYGCERSYLRSWTLKTLRVYIRLLRSGGKLRGIQGDPAQLGGDFVVDAEGILRMAHPSRDATDRPAVGDVLAVLRQLDGVAGDD